MNLHRLTLLLPVVLWCAAPLYAQGLAPDAAVQRMQVAAGLRVELVAAEPLVRQPVAIDFDDRGRLWVIQYLQYPNPEGLKRVQVDRYSRTVYDQVPKPPPHGPRGADRITILEDTDRDGRADRAKDFITGLNLTSGFAFGHGGIYVLNVPYLLFYPDRNRDDVPDGDPQVLLSGFGMQDAHSVANSLVWGPDGWLYGCQGSTVTSNIRGIEFQQGVWRYHPLSRRFELFCEGGGNSWGLDFDSLGNLLYSTNHGGFVMLHGVQGAYLWKSFGKHGALHNPYAFGYFEHVPHTGFRGGHVSVGGLFYRGTTFPEHFRGAYIAADLLGHGVYWHDVEPRGSTFSSRHAGDLLVANDTWFAPTDVALGPDGAIYISDWYDQRTAHPDPDADWDRSNGRIYRIQGTQRIQPQGGKPSPPIDITTLSSDELVDKLGDANDWIVRRARRMLAERRDPRVIPRLRTAVLEQPDKHLALETLWALYVCGRFDDSVADRLLSHSEPAIRSWTIRFLGDAGAVVVPDDPPGKGESDTSLSDKTVPAQAAQAHIPADIAKHLASVAATDASPLVWSQLACSARRLPPADALPLIEALAMRPEVAQDPCLPLLLWWAIERHAIAAPDGVLARFTSPAAWKNRLVRDSILNRLMRRYAAEGTTAALQACARMLASAPTPAERQGLLVALDEGLQLLPSVRTFIATSGTLFRQSSAGPPVQQQHAAPSIALPAALVTAIEDLYKADSADAVVLRLALRLGSRPVHERVVQNAAQSEVPQPRRLAMLGLLDDFGQPDCVGPLLALIGPPHADAVQVATLRVLDRFPDDRISRTVLAAYLRSTASVRSQARDLLFSRSAWAREFLEQVDAGRFAANEVPVDQLQRIALHQDAGLDALVRKHWGSVRAGTPGEKLAEMRRLSNDLRAAAGSAERGRAVFQKHCANCHKLHAEGTAIGPDLTHANRQDQEFLLSSLVDPGAQVRKEFLSYVIQTTDGRVATGLVAEQTPASITLVDAKNVRTTIPRSQIETLNESPVSLMPEGLHKLLSPQDVRDLFGYLKR